MDSWIKLHRSLLDWEWYDDTNTFRVFVHLLLKANYKDRTYRGESLKPGTVLTGRELLANELGLSVRQIRTALNKLKSTNEVTIKSSTKGSKIQIVNYERYQVTTSKSTNERPTNDQQATTNKKGNKEKKGINTGAILFKNSIYFDKETYYNNIILTDFKIKGLDVMHYYNSMLDWSEGSGHKRKDWLATARSWIRRDIKENKAATKSTKYANTSYNPNI
jgi:hypothetical protein